MALRLMRGGRFAVSAESGAPVVVRLHHTAPAEHQITMALHSFAMDVRGRTGGEVEVDVVTKRVRPILPPPQFASAVVDGRIEAACMPNFIWGAEIPEMNFTLIPYLFTAMGQISSFPGSAAARFLESRLETRGVHTLAWLHVTRTALLTSRDRLLVGVEDFGGVRLHAIGAIGRAMFEAVGARPARDMAAEEVYGAIQAGEVEAVMTDISSAIGLKYAEVQPYGTVAPLFSAFYHLFVSPTWLAGLRPAHREALEDAGTQLEQTAIMITEARAAAAPDVLRERGMALHMQTLPERLAWHEALRPPAMDAFLRAAPAGPALLRLVPSER